MYKHVWPYITEETKKAVMRQVEKGEISIYNKSGIFEIFEKNFAKYVETKYALAISSGTAALHTAMVACRFQPGDEVLCPAYTFFATVTPIFQTGAIPVLCEALPDGNIDPRDIEKRITSKTKAVIVTHMWGIPCAMEEISAVCQKYGLKLIEDCSHAHGAFYRGRPVGSFGDVSIFSLQGQKIITGGEGGVLVTNNKDIYQRALLFGHYNKRCLQEIDKNSKEYEYAVTGFGLKLRAHPFAIAMANEQLEHLNEWHRAKMENAKYLTGLLANIEGVSVPCVDDGGTEPSWYAYPIKISSAKVSKSAKELCQEMVEEGITDVDFPSSTCPLNQLKLFQEPGFLFPFYENKVKYRVGDFPCAELFAKEVIKLPIDIRIDQEYRLVLDSYAKVIREVIEKNRR